MKRKSIITTVLAIIVLFICSSFVFAESNNGDSVNLGNEIMKSMEKTGDSMNNFISGNTIEDTGNSLRNGANNLKDGMQNMTDDMTNGVENTANDMKNGMNNMSEDTNRMLNKNNNMGYNTTRTTAEGIGNNMDTMSTTTWMWIILVVAAIVIVAAIWYYATQGND